MRLSRRKSGRSTRLRRDEHDPAQARVLTQRVTARNLNPAEPRSAGDPIVMLQKRPEGSLQALQTNDLLVDELIVVLFPGLRIVRHFDHLDDSLNIVSSRRPPPRSCRRR